MLLNILQMHKTDSYNKEFSITKAEKLHSRNSTE
jgi:hypothetical protein